MIVLTNKIIMIMELKIENQGVIDIFLLNTIDINMKAIENITAVRNIKSKERDEGKDWVMPLTLITDWWVCIYIAANAGSIEDPIILNIVLIPIVTPVYSRGVDKIVTFTAPTEASDNPADNNAKPVEIDISFEWNINNI